VLGRNTSWLGALAPYLLPVARAGCLAQMWAQASSCRDCAPWGGIDPRFSTNPLALAFPTGGLPMVSDFSSAAISFSRTQALIRAGETVPENLYMDEDGTPTSDPAVMKDGGTLFFTGGERYGYRGYALALWAEAMAALSGGSANNPDLPYRQHFALTVIDPEAFAGADAYLAEMERFVAHLRSSRLRPGFDAIRLPGERAQRAAQRAEADGVSVSDDLVKLLNEVAARQGLDPLP
jgi:L-lactate dehydrogenase